MTPTKEDLIRITERLAERKGWRKQDLLKGTAREAMYWVTGPEDCPTIERAVSNYNPTKDLNQAEEELGDREWVLYKYNGLWDIWSSGYSFEHDPWLAEHGDLATAICLALVGWDDELQAMTK